MTPKYDKISPSLIDDVLRTTAAFYGGHSLTQLRHQIAIDKPLFKAALWTVSGLRRSNVGTLVLLWILLVIYPRKWFCGTRIDIYAVSLTHNNDRALARLAPELKALGHTLKINRLPLAWANRSHQFKWCSEISQTLRHKGDNDSFVFLNQLLGVICLGAFTADLKIGQPRLVVAANDHSPPTIALFAAARTLGIRTCYVQHGPVTKHFPPLRMDLALLSSQSSHDCYLTAAHTSGVPLASKVCLFPPLLDPVRPITKVTFPLRICIALGKFVDKQQVKDLILDLFQTSQVMQIVISQHPRCSQNLESLVTDTNIQLAPRGSTAKDISQNVDLCLVGNSGVALEFLHFGCPTFYVPPPDPKLYDYYSFCAAGVLPTFNLDFVASPAALMRPFDAIWGRKMADFDPSFSPDVATFRADIRNHLEHLLITFL